MMDEERPIEDARESSEETSQPPKDASAETTLVSGGSTTDGLAEEETAAAINTSSNDETPTDDGTSSDDESSSVSDESGGKHTWLVIAGGAIVVLLIVVGLFLPPISLGQRLGIGSEDEQTAQGEQESASEPTSADETGISLSSSAEDVNVETLPSQAFLNAETGDEWATAASSVPSGLTLSSDVYVFEYKEEAPVSSAQVVIPDSAQPVQTLDMYGWDGLDWLFIPSQVSADEAQLTSAEIQMPQAIALMQTSKPDELEIGAEVLPAQELPAAVLPYVTEVSAGTLTLAQEGQLLGDVVAVPTGGYQQFVRATNTGAVVDAITLSALLSDPAAQDRNIQQLIDRVNEGGFAGVNLDYQGVDPGQEAAFSDFVDRLAQALDEHDHELIVTLETPISNEGTWDTGGQDWQAIGQTADTIYMQMPIDPTLYGDDSEAQHIVDWATRQVSRSKLMALLSVNAVDAVGDARREVESDQALVNFGELELISGSTEIEPGEPVEVALSGSAGDLAWDPESLTYKYTYEQADQPHEVWLGSEAILSHQGRLPNRYNVRGVAVRGLGQLAQAEGYAMAMASFLDQAEAPQPSSAAIVWVVEDDSGGVLASSSGEDLTFEWEGSDQPGTFVVRADFAHGESVASLGELEVTISEAEPTPTPDTEEETVAEAESTPTAAAGVVQPASVDPGDADAAVSTPANVRKGPGVGYGIIGGVNPGEKVELTGRNEDASWYQIVMADGTEGWIFATLVTVNPKINVNLLAVIEVEPPSTVAGGGGGGAPPPVIAPAGGGNFELGGQTHSLANPQLMNMAGMNWVKFQHKWGPGDSPGAVAGRIAQAHANGFKVLLSMPGTPYPSSIDFNSYVNFLGGVAALGPDAIEVWNEENIDFEWPAGQIDPNSYVNNMLAPAYNAIKSANPNVMVIMGAPAPTGFDNGTNAWSDSRYMAGVAAAGGANYMDCIGVHHNAGATSPSAASGHPAGNNHYSWFFGPTMNMYYNSFGGSRPVCFTELGYLSGEDFGGVPSRFSWAAGTSVGEHAQWLAEAVSLAANSGKVRLVIIFNVDFTQWGDDPQAGFAMLRPDGSCPSCGLLGQVMGG